MPLAGSMSDSQTLYCNESGQWIDYRSDEHGFRNPSGSHGARSKVVLLGDSFAQGYCVPRGDTVADSLRSGGWPVLNLGNDDNGPLVSLAALKEYGLDYREPRVVVWMHYEGNDFVDLSWEYGIERLRSYLGEGGLQHLRSKQSAIDELFAEYWESRNESEALSTYERVRSVLRWAVDRAKLTAVRTRLRRLRPRGEATLDYPKAQFEEVMDELLRVTRAPDLHLLFVYLPEFSRLSELDFTDHREQVLRSLAERNVDVLDVTSLFEALPDPLSVFPHRTNGHYNAEGYRAIAQAVEVELERLLGAEPERTID